MRSPPPSRAPLSAAPSPLRPWRGAAGRATRPSSCPRPSAPYLSPAGRSSATRSVSSAASAAWPRKPASARSGPPRYRPPGAGAGRDAAAAGARGSRRLWGAAGGWSRRALSLGGPRGSGAPSFSPRVFPAEFAVLAAVGTPLVLFSSRAPVAGVPFVPLPQATLMTQRPCEAVLELRSGFGAGEKPVGTVRARA